MRPISILLATLVISSSTGCYTLCYVTDLRNRRGRPDQVLDAKIAGEDQLYALVRYKNGLTRVVTTTLVRRTSRYPLARIHAESIDQDFDAIEGRAIRVAGNARAGSPASAVIVQDAYGFDLDLYEDEYRFVIHLDIAPINWLSAETYITLVLLPFPVVLDVVTSPIQLFLLLTVDEWP